MNKPATLALQITKKQRQSYKQDTASIEISFGLKINTEIIVFSVFIFNTSQLIISSKFTLKMLQQQAGTPKMNNVFFETYYKLVIAFHALQQIASDSTWK